jgi:hypothetical protein
MATVGYDENRQDRYRETKVQPDMAVDYGGVIYPTQGQPGETGGGTGIMARIEQHPVAAFLIALIFAIAAGYLISKLRGSASSSSTTSTTNQPGTSQGLPTTDAQGNKVYYVPTSNTFLDYNNIQDSYNPNNSVATSTVTTTSNSTDADNGQHDTPPPAPATHYTGMKPLIPYGQYNGPNYSNLKAPTYFSFQGIRYLLMPGGGDRLWGKTPWGQEVLLYGPAGYYTSSFQPQTVTAPAGYPSGFPTQFS